MQKKIRESIKEKEEERLNKKMQLSEKRGRFIKNIINI